MRKIFMISIIIIIVLFACSVGVQAIQSGDSNVRIAQFKIGQASYTINGQTQSMDAAPFIKNGTTFIPLRYAGLALNCADEDIQWDADKKKATLARKYDPKDGNAFAYDTVELTIGSDVFKSNGWACALSWSTKEKPMMKDGRVYVPFRVVCHALGGLAFWDARTKTITIETWQTLPAPTKQTVSKVEVTKGSSVAKVTGIDGVEKTVQTVSDILVGPNGRYIVNTIEWLKLWGVKDSEVLYDPVRGGLAVRGTSAKNVQGSKQNCGYVYVYKGDKSAWDNFNAKYPDPIKNAKAYSQSDPVYITNGLLYDGGAGILVPSSLWEQTHWETGGIKGVSFSLSIS